MSNQDLDVMYVQNPALGAALLWKVYLRVLL